MSEASKPINRRAALEILGGMSLLGLTAATLGINACDDGEETPTPTPPGCGQIPDETAGPYGDITGMSENPAYYRQDITEGKAGIPLSLMLTVVDANNGCVAVPNATVEIWHCDAEGHYSEYSQPGYDGTGTTFLRGLQISDANGQVKFTTIYPGWYQGRVTHIHVEIFVNGALVKTTQFAFPESITTQVYTTAAYVDNGQNPTNNSRDSEFSDGIEYQMLSVTGNTTNGYVGTLPLGIAL